MSGLAATKQPSRKDSDGARSERGSEAAHEAVMQAEDDKSAVQTSNRLGSGRRSVAGGGGQVLSAQADRFGRTAEQQWVGERAESHHVEPFVTRVELAKIMRVSIGTIDAMVREGMPSITLCKRCRRFRASAAVAWAESRRSA